VKRWFTYLLITVSFIFASKANGQNIVQTYIDPCDSKVYTVVVPISSNQPGVLVLIRNKSRIFTYADFASGTVTKWVNDIFSTPCPIAIVATVAQQAAQAASNAASQAASSAASAASSSASSTAAASTSGTSISSSSSSTSSSSSSSSQSSSSSGESSSSSSSSESSGGETKTESSSSESKSESKSEKKSESKKKEQEKKKEERKANPPIVKADLSVIQMGSMIVPTFNVNMSKTLNEGMFSYGLSTSIRADLKQIVIGGSTSDIIIRNGKVFGVTTTSVTYVTDWDNKFIFYGWSFVKPLNKGAVAGLALSGNSLILTGTQVMLSPSIIAFYTKPYQISRKQTISPEIYVISSPVMFGQRDKKATYDANVSFFTGAGTDVRFSKKFKLNVNFKVNISTNSSIPLMSVFALGSKINI
jgi:hypothetical protein